MSEVDYERIGKIATEAAISAAGSIPLEKMKIVAKEAAKEALHESAQMWGMDVSDPIKMQKNQAFLNSSRQRSEDVSKTIMTKAAEVGVVGFIVYLGTILTFKG